MTESNDLVSSEGTIRDLFPDDLNANLGTERGSYLLEHSLERYGAGRSVLADRNLKLIAGNKTVEGAAAIGLENVIIVPTDGTKLVVVQRTDLDMDDPKARELAILDNRISELNLEWSPEMLNAISATGATINDFWSESELKEIMNLPPAVEFKELDENLANEVSYNECPNCGHRYPK